MKRSILQSTISTLAALRALGTVPARAQKATEMFVPIGQSAGLSGKHTTMGRIAGIDIVQRSLTLMEDGSARTVRLDDRTQLWLDLSKQQQPNRKTTLAELRPDMMAEAKYRNNDRTAGIAEWIKAAP